MLNFISDGERMAVVLTAAANAGDVVIVGSKVGIAITSGNIGDTIAIMNEGAFELAKASVAIAQGQSVYYDSVNNVVTTVASGNILVGYAYNAALSTDPTAQVLIVDNPPMGPAANIPAISTADATDLASVEALANATKAVVNEILANLKAIDLMVHD